MRKLIPLFRTVHIPVMLFFSVLCSGVPAHSADGILEELDRILHWEAQEGRVQIDGSGLLDLESYWIDRRPPGLLFGETADFGSPRLSLFLDARLGDRYYFMAQARFDQGFDPRAKKGDVRLDECFLRFQLVRNGRVNLQFGKFATMFGNWVNRHDSWRNPLISAALPYENVMALSDQAAPASPVDFLAIQTTPMDKATWIPIIWGPSYASGASVFGTLRRVDFAFEVKNSALSSRPEAWGVKTRQWNQPTFTGRIGTRPTAAWNLGVSASRGPYLLENAVPTLPRDASLSDFNQITFGQDSSFAWRHWQVWMELVSSRFEVPNAGKARSTAYFVEARRQFAKRLFGALRWNQQFFSRIEAVPGRPEPWDRKIWRTDFALGYRFTRHLQGKVQYSLNRETGELRPGEHFFAAQLTARF